MPYNQSNKYTCGDVCGYISGMKYKPIQGRFEEIDFKPS